MVNGIEITGIGVEPLDVPSRARLLARAYVVLNDCLKIRGLRLIDGDSGLFVQFPNRWCRNQAVLYDVCHPLTHELRRYVTDAVVSAYRERIGQSATVLSSRRA